MDKTVGDYSIIICDHLNKSYVYIDRYHGTDTHLVLPSHFGGMPVTKIGYMAFHDNDTLVSVTIPRSLIFVCNHAFKRCNELVTIKMYKNVNAHAFDIANECPSFKGVTCVY